MRRRRMIPSTLTAAVALLMMLAACGGTPAESDAASEPPVTAESIAPGPETSDAPPAASAPMSAAPASQPEPGEAGSFTVDDTTFAVTMLNRCIPFRDEPGNFDLQALAPGAQLNLYLDAGRTDVSVQGSAVQELAGSIAFALDDEVADSAVSGDRWTGSATVVDATGSGTTVELAWDVQIPTEVRDCSL